MHRHTHAQAHPTLPVPPPPPAFRRCGAWRRSRGHSALLTSSPTPAHCPYGFSHVRAAELAWEAVCSSGHCGNGCCCLGLVLAGFSPLSLSSPALLETGIETRLQSTAVAPSPGMSAHSSFLLPATRKPPIIHITFATLHSPGGKRLQGPQEIPLHTQQRWESEALPSVPRSSLCTYIPGSLRGRGAGGALSSQPLLKGKGLGPDLTPRPCQPLPSIVLWSSYPCSPCPAHRLSLSPSLSHIFTSALPFPVDFTIAKSLSSDPVPNFAFLNYLPDTPGLVCSSWKTSSPLASCPSGYAKVQRDFTHPGQCIFGQRRAWPAAGMGTASSGMHGLTTQHCQRSLSRSSCACPEDLERNLSSSSFS